MNPCPLPVQHLWQWHPPIGTFIGVLAFLGVIVPWLFRPPEKMGRPEKAVWTAVMFLLMIAEVHSLYRDRNEHDAELAQAQCEQVQRFGQIAGELEQSIQQNQQQFQQTLRQQQQDFSATMGKTQSTLDAVTGGNSYCYALATFLSEDYASLFVHTRGNSPLHDVRVEMADIDKEQELLTKKLSTMELKNEFVHPLPTIPFLASSSDLDIGEVTIKGRTSRNIALHFFSMNGNWDERISLRLINGKWAQTIVVTKEVRGKLQVLYTYLAPDWPRLKNGRPDWR